MKGIRKRHMNIFEIIYTLITYFDRFIYFIITDGKYRSIIFKLSLMRNLVDSIELRNILNPSYTYISYNFIKSSFIFISHFGCVSKAVN